MNGVAAVVANLECFCLEVKRISRLYLKMDFFVFFFAKTLVRSYVTKDEILRDLTTSCDAVRCSAY